MIRTLAASAMLLLALVMPAQQAKADDVLDGMLFGGALGAIFGGAVTGRGSGALAGMAIGAATGAIIAAEGRRRRGGFYWWHERCYYRYPNGDWVRVNRRNCW
jgi:hypothetical protein